ncbi:anthranilate synthase component 1 [Algicola sagamiensis]|uniref:anthranilate synthase component 1 n=1 Tax=Algicola sagamiensis TaxID=163869 RepID=UPI00036B93F2|nr:anthranilate synthase component 1 [Algicola sagamiensis]
MIFSHIDTTPGEVSSISLATKYPENLVDVFRQVCTGSHHLLLESSEIDSKCDLKSMLLIDAALRMECLGNTVQIEAHSENGETLLRYLIEQLQPKANIHFPHQRLCSVTFTASDQVTDEDSRLKADNAFTVLRDLIHSIQSPQENPFSLFIGGVFAYDMLANFENLPDVPMGDNTCPDYVFYVAETLLVVDHTDRSATLTGNIFNGKDAFANCFAVGRRLEELQKQINAFTAQPSQPQSTENSTPAKPQVSVSDEAFCQQVESLKKHIVDGDIFQVVPSRSFLLPCHDALKAYSHLKSINPSPYMFFMKDKDFELFGASPESALKFESNTRDVEVYPIAGTRKRGETPDIDSRIELELREDTKEKSEHLMLVDLARNDIARISEPGSRHVPVLMKVDRYSHVMHLISRVKGTLRKDLDALHAYQACMNMGTLVGAPKISAAQLIRQVEKTRRGSYGGAVGYLNGNGDMDSCIVIRSAFVRNKTAYIQAGAGVVFDSDPQAEADESRNKAQAVINAVHAAMADAQTGKE